MLCPGKVRPGPLSPEAHDPTQVQIKSDAVSKELTIFRNYFLFT